MQNPILTVFKTAAFLLLAFLVGMSFWQGSRQEKKVMKIEMQLSQLQEDMSDSRLQARKARESVDRLSGAVEALTDVVSAGSFHAPAGGAPSGSAGSNGAGPKTVGSPTRARTRRRSGGALPKDGTLVETCPAYFSDAAQALWGQRDSYLTQDPDWITYPDMDAPGVESMGRVRRWYGSQPPGINPITSSDGLLTVRVKEYCLRGIANRHVKNPSSYRPELALRVEVNKPDYTEWVVWLRNDVYWHKPQVDLNKYPHLRGRHKLTAHDVKFTIDTILNKDVDAAHLRNYYSECEGVDIIDDFCFIVRWRKPQYNSIDYTLSLETLPRFVFAFDEAGTEYDEGQFGVAFNKHWFCETNHFIGCGPYYVAEYEPSSHWLLRRNDEYYGRQSPINEIYQQIFDGRPLALKKLENGEFDFASVPVRHWEKKTIKEKGENPFSDGSMEEEWLWGVSYSFIGWKQNHPIFKDVKVRTAMTMACNRPRLRDDLELGEARITTGPQHVKTPFSDPDGLKPLPFDLDKAKALLAQAGWTDSDEDGVLDKVIDGQKKDFRFTAMVPNNQLFIPIFEIFQADLHKIGVEMKLDLLIWKQFKERLDARSFECTALLWSGDGWESDLYQIWHSSQIDEVPSSNFIEFSDPASDKMMEELRATFEPAERLKKQQALHRRIAELQPYTFLLTYRMPIMWWKNRVGNVPAGCQYVVRPTARLYPWTILQDK